MRPGSASAKTSCTYMPKQNKDRVDMELVFADERAIIADRNEELKTAQRHRWVRKVKWEQRPAAVALGWTQGAGDPNRGINGASSSLWYSMTLNKINVVACDKARRVDDHVWFQMKQGWMIWQYHMVTASGRLWWKEVLVKPTYLRPVSPETIRDMWHMRHTAPLK